MTRNPINNDDISDSFAVVKPKRRRSRVADYTCFGVAAGAPDVIHGEQIAPHHKIRAWLFLNRSPSRRWLYGHLYCDTMCCQNLSRSVDITQCAACCIVIRTTYRDTLVTIRDTYRDTHRDTYRDTNRSRYNTSIAGPSIAMHRCIVTTLVKGSKYCNWASSVTLCHHQNANQLCHCQICCQSVNH